MNKLLETVKKYPQTQIWNDSCSCKELQYAIDNGAVGATTNPVIVLNVLKNEMDDWKECIENLIQDNPTASEDDIAWKLIKIMGTKASKLLLPIFENSQKTSGRISFQTNPKYFNNAEKMVAHALSLTRGLPNAQIKIPASKAGIEACEELTYQGISINATISFTVSQAIAVAEAVERGLKRRQKENLPIEDIHPVCTIMAGRVDDYLKKDCSNKNMLIEPEPFEWAGVAVVKHAYNIYQGRKYKTRLLVAAFRNPYHWLEFIGGDIVLTIPYKWQNRYNSSDYEIKNFMQKPIETIYLNKLKQFEEFNKAYAENGLSAEEFENYGAFKMTILSFLEGYDELCKLIRGYMVK